MNGVIGVPMRRVLDSGSVETTSTERCTSSTPTLVPLCVVESASMWSSSSAVCSVPPGVGGQWEILLRGFWTALQGGYHPPAVTAVFPSELDVEGGSLLISGENFGESVCQGSAVEMLVSEPPLPMVHATFDLESLQWVFPVGIRQAWMPCAVSTWSSTSIECTAPPGIDARVTLRVTAGGQVNSTLGLVGYGSPVVVQVQHDPVMPSSGGTLVQLRVSRVPRAPWPHAVTIGGRECAMETAQWSGTSLTASCRTPVGGGVASVVAHSPLQRSNGTATVVYSGPFVSGVTTPLGRPIIGGFLVQLRGQVRKTSQA